MPRGGPVRARRAALLACCALAGCAVGPDYRRPAVSAPPAWAAHGTPGGVPSRPASTPPDPRWWAAFGDPELTSLERRLANQNLDIRLATIRLAESRQERRISAADEFPQVNGTSSYDRVRLSPRGEFGLIGGGSGGTSGDSGLGGNGGGAGGSSAVGLPIPSTGLGAVSSAIRQPFNLYQYGFDASWELDLWGRVRRSIEAADAALAASAEDRRNALVSNEAELARDYIQLRNAQAQLAIARENQAIAQQALTLAQERFRGGLVTQLDTTSAQAQLETVVAGVPQLEQREAQAINRLSFLLGEAPGALAPELREARPVPPTPPVVPVGLPSDLARRRPDIRMADAKLHQAVARVGVAEADFYPSVTLSGNLTIQAIRFANLGNWDSRTYTFGPSLTLPIFQGGRLLATLKLRRTEQQEAAIDFRRTVLNAFREVDDALVAYDAEQRRRARLAAAMEQDRASLALAQQRYRQGLEDFLRVLDAERQLLAAQQQWQDSTATVSTDLASLYLALGGGWETTFPVARRDGG